MTRSLRALERHIFLPDKLTIAVKFDPISTSILDTIASQYIITRSMWFHTISSSKPYTRLLIKRRFLPYNHPEYSDQHGFCMCAAEEFAAHQKAFSVVLHGPYFIPAHQSPSSRKISSIRYTPEPEEPRAVRFVILQRTQYIDLEIRRIRRLKLKEYNCDTLPPDTMDQNWRPNISVGFDVP
jgi:hypothetical protein